MLFRSIDPATGEDARSVIGEDNLRAIGEQLGLPYVHRESGDSIAPVVSGVDLERFGTSEAVEQQRVRSRQELYWLLLIGVAGLAVWELGASLTALSQTRRRKEAGA